MEFPERTDQEPSQNAGRESVLAPQRQSDVGGVGGLPACFTEPAPGDLLARDGGRHRLHRLSRSEGRHLQVTALSQLNRRNGWHISGPAPSSPRERRRFLSRPRRASRRLRRRGGRDPRGDEAPRAPRRFEIPPRHPRAHLGFPDRPHAAVDRPTQGRGGVIPADPGRAAEEERKNLTARDPSPPGSTRLGMRDDRAIAL